MANSKIIMFVGYDQCAVCTTEMDRCLKGSSRLELLITRVSFIRFEELLVCLSSLYSMV